MRYGGYLPKVLTKYGMTYGNVSHQVLRESPVVAARLAPLQPPSKESEPNPLNCQCMEGLEYHKKGIMSDQGAMYIPEHVCPGYTGCLNIERKCLPPNTCCEKLLRSLGCGQEPCGIEESTITEDPLPGPPKMTIDHTQERRRGEDGMWKRFPKNYVAKETHRWM